MNNYSLPDYSKVKNDLAEMPDGDPSEIYGQGFVGSYYDPEEEERLADLVRSDGGKWEMEDTATSFGFAGQGSGKTILLFKELEPLGWLEKLGYPSQKVGDCVSHGTAKAMGYTLAAGINRGQGSKPETGGIESRMFPIASETHYWYRGRSGDGWSASSSLRVVKEKTGIVIRKKFPFCDLTEYSARTAHLYGSRSPSGEVADALDDNPVLTYSRCGSYEEIIDAISAGYGVQTDGGEGFAKTVDENGVARRSGHWSHSMSCSGFIDTPEFKSKYGCGGLVYQNSWGAWNNNSNGKIMGTNVGLPKGSFVALWKDVSRRSYYAVSNVKTWPNRKLRSWDIVRDLI